MLGRASGGTWKVFTFVEGPVSVKDDRASASENQVCMGFFFFSPSKHSNSQEVRYSARQKSRSASDGDVVVGEPGVGRAPSCLSGLVPSHPGCSELGKDDTCPRPFHGFQLNSTGASLDAHTGHLPPPTPGIFRCFGGNRCCRASPGPVPV